MHARINKFRENSDIKLIFYLVPFSHTIVMSVVNFADLKYSFIVRMSCDHLL